MSGYEIGDCLDQAEKLLAREGVTLNPTLYASLTIDIAGAIRKAFIAGQNN